ncbi:hypothetical protein [uncultured Sulfitobacter sp.]|uniref:hypothetical protein n=1 Tax=uncultured Sulfitobacter sp. TaxID=191468 RepID=UPI002622361E|nr:hypothetical protein [uncultured Sulfitobacter sp.]
MPVTPHPNNGKAPKVSYLRLFIGFVLLIPGVVFWVAPAKLFKDIGADSINLQFIGIVLVAMGVTLLVTHFEDPDATLSGALPGAGEKLGVFMKGYVLLFICLLVGGIVSLFFVLDPLKAERSKLEKDRTALATKQSELKALTKEISDKLTNLDGAGALHTDLKKQIREDAKLVSVMTSYLQNTSVPIEVRLKCPDDGNLSATRVLQVSKINANKFGLVVDPTQTRLDQNRSRNQIKIVGMSPHQMVLYARPDLKDSDRILALEITRESAAMIAQIELKNLKLFNEVCENTPEETVDDLIVSGGTQSDIKQKVSGP